MQATPATHDFLEHTGELRLRVRAQSLDGLFAEAGRALGVAMHRAADAPGPAGAWLELEASGGDLPALLVAWLNELVFVAEASHMIPAEFERVQV
jgi:SHS2 domain-containing protein